VCGLNFNPKPKKESHLTHYYESDKLKQDSLIVFIIGAIVTLVISNLLIYIISPADDRVPIGVGVSLFIIIIWLYPWFAARSKKSDPKPKQLKKEVFLW
jgi:hypothetical protein